jgi:hypothetical protein
VRYATKQTFGTQRASLGRIVLVNTKTGGLSVGVVVGIRPNDELIIQDLVTAAQYHGFQFVTTIVERELETMPERTWTWPPRVQ